MKKLGALLIGLTLMVQAWAGPFEGAVEAFNCGDSASAMKQLENKEYARAQIALGAVYQKDAGLAQNPAEAGSLIRNALPLSFA